MYLMHSSKIIPEIFPDVVPEIVPEIVSEFNKNCIYQVFSDIIQKCISYYTAQVCIAQGFTVLTQILLHIVTHSQIYHTELA